MKAIYTRTHTQGQLCRVTKSSTLSLKQTQAQGSIKADVSPVRAHFRNQIFSITETVSVCKELIE